ncbi:hypothetical protein ACIBI4_10150 [Streptomyces sp. NPDC050418]|uniref:hypothetical protein n=1 Tax=Streptomyces sp. NPDC050418 TaxID=3365612 RepID=UPI0037AC9C8F
MGVPGPDLERWTEEGHLNIVGVARMLGVPEDVYESDPIALIPALQQYVERLPLAQFEESDWVTLQTDLMSYLADFLVRRHGARWALAEDPASPRGYRYVVEAAGLDGVTRRLDPASAVVREVRHAPIEITRMLAAAELDLHLVRAPGAQPAPLYPEQDT